MYFEKEACLNNFPSSYRTSAFKNSPYVGYLFYGSNNSPAYNWYTEEEIRTIDPDVKKAALPSKGCAALACIQRFLFYSKNVLCRYRCKFVRIHNEIESLNPLS